jgi:ABC-type sugar transport system substrate-binding protein
VTNLRAQWTEASAQRSVESWLRLNTSHKVQIDVVGAQNDVMAVGAQKAFGDIGDPGERQRWLNLPYTGVDGLPKTGQAWVRTGGLAATVAVPPNAGPALSMLVEAIQTGRRPAERTFTVAESYPPIEKLVARKGFLIPTA